MAEEKKHSDEEEDPETGLPPSAMNANYRLGLLNHDPSTDTTLMPIELHTGRSRHFGGARVLMPRLHHHDPARYPLDDAEPDHRARPQRPRHDRPYIHPRNLHEEVGRKIYAAHMREGLALPNDPDEYKPAQTGIRAFRMEGDDRIQDYNRGSTVPARYDRSQTPVEVHAERFIRQRRMGRTMSGRVHGFRNPQYDPEEIFPESDEEHPYRNRLPGMRPRVGPSDERVRHGFAREKTAQEEYDDHTGWKDRDGRMINEPGRNPFARDRGYTYMRELEQRRLEEAIDGSQPMVNEARAPFLERYKGPLTSSPFRMSGVNAMFSIPIWKSTHPRLNADPPGSRNRRHLPLEVVSDLGDSDQGITEGEDTPDDMEEDEEDEAYDADDDTANESKRRRHFL